MWKKALFFCLYLLCWLPVVLPQERYHPISEAELSRLEELSAARTQLSTQALVSIKGLETTLIQLKAKHRTLADLLSQAEALTTKSRELYVEYVKGASSIIEKKNERITVLEEKVKFWQVLALTLFGVILLCIVLQALFARLKIP